MNSDLLKKALEKVLNPNVLVNMVSQRVRQLNAGGGALSRPLLSNTANLGLADIALSEIIEGKMGFYLAEHVVPDRPTARSRKKPQSWAKSPPERKAA